MEKRPCVFCRIVRGELPARRVYEDEKSLVFMDTAADVDGHMVAIPKSHVESILDCDRESLCALMDAVQRVSAHCVTDCGYDGVNLLNASGAAAGQSVPHFHIHIIPRRTQDGLVAWPRFPGAAEGIEKVYQGLKMPQK